MPRQTSWRNQRLLGLPGRDVGARHVAAGGLGEVDVASLGDQQRVVARLGHAVLVDPQLAHLGGGLDVVAAAVELQPVGVGQPLAGGDADQGVLGVGVLGVVVVRVVGGQRRDAERPCRAAAGRRGPASRSPMPWSISSRKKLSLPNMSWNSAGRAARLVVLPEAQAGLHLARGAAGGGDQALGVLAEQLAVGAGLVVEALQARARRQPEQVVHARRCLGPHRHVGVGATARDVVAALLGGVPAAPAHPAALVAAGAGGEVGLQTDDRLDAVLARLGPEVEGPVQVAVVGHRDRGHPQLRRPLEQAVQQRGAVEHGVLGVHVQVDEPVPLGGHGGRSALPGASGWRRRSCGGDDRAGPGLTPGRCWGRSPA